MAVHEYYEHMPVTRCLECDLVLPAILMRFHREADCDNLKGAHLWQMHHDEIRKKDAAN